MTFLFVFAAAVLIVAGFHLVYAWIFSNGLHREILAIRDREKDLGVRVRAVSDETIDLAAPQPRQDIGHPGEFGLAWNEGYARVGDVVGASDGWVTRRFTEGESGMPPICEGPLQDCPPIEMDGYFYPGDPGDAGLEFEEISFEGPLGPLDAWLIPGVDPYRWAIHCHGWTAEKRELVRLLPTFHASGRTSVVIDYRNDPGTPQDPSGRYRFGVTEWADLEAAVRYALDHGAEEVVLTGCSTGGALVMALLERSDLAEKVTGIVLDAPNVALVDTIRHGLHDVRATRLMKEFGLWMAGLRWKIDWEATNYVQRASQTLTVPALVFHGTSDHVVPISTSRQLEAQAPDLVELVETPAAGHVLSWNANPERYETHLARFLERV